MNLCHAFLTLLWILRGLDRLFISFSNPSRDFYFIKYLLGDLHEKLPHLLTGNLGFCFLWLALLESQPSVVRVYHQMLYWLFHWTYLVFILSNRCNTTSQLCNYMFILHPSNSLIQIFLEASSTLGASFSDRPWEFFNFCFYLRFPSGQRSQTLLTSYHPARRQLSISIFLQQFCQKTRITSVLEVSGERIFPSLIAGWSQFHFEKDIMQS